MAKKSNKQPRGGSTRQQQLPLVWGEGRIDSEETVPAAPQQDTAHGRPASPSAAVQDAAFSAASVFDGGDAPPGPVEGTVPSAPAPLGSSAAPSGEVALPGGVGDNGGSAQAGIVIRLSSGDLSFSDLMVEARGAANLTIRQTAEKTKVPAEFVESIETGTWEKVPDNFYTRTYVRRLCKAYGIDVEPIISCLDRELSERDTGDGVPGFGTPMGSGTNRPTIFQLSTPEGSQKLKAACRLRAGL
ncbi:MAG: helix-turn-helix domain-containing protein [Kiritimatiellaeota bacterium]|nr:helix-turn-helix domain-containing protein [Kiritimatiellota bacterium]